MSEDTHSDKERRRERERGFDCCTFCSGMQATNILTSPLETAAFPFSKIFFPYLSDPLGEIHLYCLTQTSSSKSVSLAAALSSHTPAAAHTDGSNRSPCLACSHRHRHTGSHICRRHHTQYLNMHHISSVPNT